MADVSVEFGATDTGLEKTLKTIQDQMTSLQGEVDSGTLSFQEINQKMRELKQAEGIFTKLGGEMSESAKSAKDFQDQMRAAEAVTKANRSALDIYSEEVDKLTKLLDSGLISQKTYASAIEKAEAALKAATPQTDEAKRANEELEASLKKAEAETRALADEQKKAEAITKANRSATEIYNQEVEELQKHLSGGRISMETFEKAVAKADAKLAAANPQVEELGKDIAETGNKSVKFGNDSSIGFAKMAGAVAVGQAAFEAFKGAATLGISAVTGAIGSLANSFTSAIDSAAKMETLETAFIPLLGSVQAAQDRIAELAKFAAETPFELPEIAAASKTLETLTRGALSTSEGLRLVGDVASATNAPFNEIATTVGRLYDGLQSGRPVGEVMQRLQELGAVSGDTRAQIEALSKEGKNTEAWLVAEEALNRFSGSMKVQSGTWSGLLSTLRDGIDQSLAKFGRPIIDSLKPYLKGIIATVDLVAQKAVDFGTAFAENFIASSESAKSFQKAIDAISTGQVEAGFNLFWETLKLQAMETGNSIYKSLVASFQTAGDFISEIFRSNGPIALTFEQFGKAISNGLKSDLFSALAEIGQEIPFLGESFANSMREKSQEASDSVNTAYQLMKYNSGVATADMADQLGKVPENFKANLAKVPPLFGDITAQQAVVKAAQDAISTAAGQTAAAHSESSNKLNITGTTLEKIAQTEELLAQATAEGNTQLAERLEKNLKVLKSQAEGEAAAARAKALSLEIIELETKLNEAKAAGNEELAKTLEQDLQRKKATEEIAKLTTEYQKTLGVTKTEAGILAENFVNAKNAAAEVKIDKTTVADAKKEAAEAAEAAKSFATWLDYIKGVDPSQGVKSAKEQAADARKEIEAFGEYIGKDLANKSYPDVARELGISTLGMTGTEQMEAILGYIDSKRGELTGIQPIDEKGGKASLDNLTAKIASLGTTPQTLNLDASASIEKIKGEFKKNIDLAVSTGEGSKILGEIKTFVSEIKTLVQKIEPKLPVPALA